MLAPAEQNRAFGYAIAASILLHALVLSLHAPFRYAAAPPPPAAPLVAHLAEPAPPAVKESAPAQEPKSKPKPKPKPKPEPKAKAKPKAQPKPAHRPAKRSLPEPALEEGMSQSEMAPPPAPAVSAPATPVAPPAAPVSPPSAAVAPSVAAPHSDPLAALARFRQQLVDYAVRYKRYPRMAVDNGWTGDVVVRIEVSANGTVSAVKVKTSSGYDALDEQALEMFRRAAPEVAVPDALRGKAFSVEVRAIYNLRDRSG